MVHLCTQAWVQVLLRIQAWLGWVKVHQGTQAWAVLADRDSPSLGPGVGVLLAVGTGHMTVG